MVKFKKNNFGFENSSFDFDAPRSSGFGTSFQSEVYVYSIRDLCKGQEEPNITEYSTFFG